MTIEFSQLSIDHGIFYLFSAIALFASTMVILSKNPVRAVLFLVMAFVSMAGVWMCLQAEFLAITLVLVYVGAVMVLFLFVVMMLDLEAPKLKEKFVRFFPLGILVAGGFIALLLNKVGHWKIAGASPKVLGPSGEYSNIKTIGELLYTQYIWPFEIAGVILLVAIVASIGLTFRGRRGSIAPKAGDQVKVRKADRVRLINMSNDNSNPTGEQA